MKSIKKKNKNWNLSKSLRGEENLQYNDSKFCDFRPSRTGYVRRAGNREVNEAAHDFQRFLTMPAEWELHEATWMAWPHNLSHWPGKFEPIPHVYVKIAAALSQSEKVSICVNDEAMEKAAKKLLQTDVNVKMEQVRFFRIPTDASWSRDHGPIFVKDGNGKLVIIDWIFNAWGAKYEPWKQDDIVPQKIAKLLDLPIMEPGIVMEGGSIDVNGRGSLLTTEQCLLNKNRNPHLSRKEIEEYLEKYFGATNVLWLKEGIIGDDTDGHIDDIARFVDRKKVVCAVESNPKDENYEILQKNLADLKMMKDESGKPLEIVEIPMPRPVVYENQRLPASYVNFYIANSAVLVPTFQCPQDEEALEILQKLFPNRRVIGIDSVDFVWGLGTIHCSTQQQPK